MLIFSFLSIAAVLSFAEHQTLCGVEYQYKEVIGTGSFATVYRAVNTITHEVVAIKRKLSALIKDREYLMYCRRENWTRRTTACEK